MASTAGDFIYPNYTGYTMEKAFHDLSHRVAIVENHGEQDMVARLMKMQERLINQLTEENTRLKKELEKHGG